MNVNEARTLRFPKYHSVGWVKVPKTGNDPHNNWTLIGTAIGEVTPPTGAPIRLVVDSSAANDLSWLDAIDPDQITELYLCQTNVNNSSLKHVARLNGLQVLSISHTYENISDLGIFHIKILKNLRKLCINATDICDISLSYLRDLNKIEVLSIGATKITDEGLKYLYDLTSLKEISFTTAYSARKNFISEEGIRLLKKALPHCQINTDTF